MIKSKNIEKKTKIALVCYSLSAGGLERIVSNQSFMFAEMGFDVHLYVLCAAIDYPFTGTLHQFDIEKYSGAAKIKKYLELRKSIKENHFDFIIDHRYRLNSVSEFFWQKFVYNKEKTINYIHHFEIEKYLLSSAFLNKLLYQKNTFICVSKGIEAKVNQKFPFLKTKTIYNSVSIQDFENEQIKEDKFILAVARMDKTNIKQVDVLLECFAKSALPEKNYKLIIIGSGERKSQMENLSKELNISNNVVFKGFLANPYPYFSEAKFTVLTSRSEGLPTVLTESLMLGTPVVSFDCETGPSEIITNEENGLFVENQDKAAFIKAMNRLAKDEILYQKLKSNSKKSAEKFSKKIIESEWEKFLSDKH